MGCARSFFGPQPESRLMILKSNEIGLYVSPRLDVYQWLSFQCFLTAFSFLMRDNKFFTEILWSTTLLIIVLTVCLITIRKLPRMGFNFFDPGVIFLFYIAVIVLPIALLGCVDFDGLNLNFKDQFVSRVLFAKTLQAHMIFISSFSFIYIIVSLCYRMNFQSSCKVLSTSKLCLWLALAFVAIDISFKVSLNLFSFNPWTNKGTAILSHAMQSLDLIVGQIYHKLTLMEMIFLVFSVGMFTAKASCLKAARIRLLSILFLIFIVHFYLTTERGFIFVLGLGAAAFADVIRWKGSLLNYRLVILGIVGVFSFNIITSAIESRIVDGHRNPFKNMDIARIVTVGPGLASPLWITTKSIQWIDENEIPLRHGQGYLDGLKGLVPSQFRNVDITVMSTWFTMRLAPDVAERGGGYGFSSVAEGYINGKMSGVLFHGALLGLLGAGIRFLQVSDLCKPYGIFFYAIMMSCFYRCYNLGFVSIVSRFRWNILMTLFAIILISILMVATRRPKDINV